MKNSGVEWLEKIPTDWNIIRMTKCFKFFKGLDIKKTDLVQYGCAVISYGQVHDKINNGYSFHKNLIRYIDQSMLETKGKSRLSNGDFIFADTSEDFDGVGSCIYIDSNDELYAGYHTLVARCIDPNVYHKYLAFLFLTDAWRSQLRRNANGTKVYSVTQRMFKFVSCLLPPVDIQLKIVAYLEQKCDDVDNIISKEQSVIEKLQEYRQSIITETVTKGLDSTVNMVASNVEWIDKIPLDWKITRFTKSFEFFKGLNIKKTDLVDSGACVVSYGQVHAKNNNGYSLQDNLIRYVAENLIDEKSLLQEGDFVFADTSEDLDGVGNCIYIDSSNEIYAGYHTLVARCFDEGICTKYFAFLFLTDIWRSQLRKNANGTKVYSVTQKMFKTVSCLVPPVEEQLKIVSYLEQKCDAIDSVISQKLTIIDTLAEYKRSLIYEVVTGKKEVLHV